MQDQSICNQEQRNGQNKFNWSNYERNQRMLLRNYQKGLANIKFKNVRKNINRTAVNKIRECKSRSVDKVTNNLSN